jgi:dihydrofolate reductase
VVTGEIEADLKQARAVTGDRDISVCAADVARQFLKSDLLDEIHIDLIPVLPGSGVRLLAGPGDRQFGLEPTRAVESGGVTRLSYRVQKLLCAR